MPLTTRVVTPSDLSLHRLSANVQRDEFQCVANGTLANLIRQLGSLSSNAEQIFTEIHRETLKLDHKTNTLLLRINRLIQKVSQSEFTTENSSLEENQLKAFKSCNIIDQHTLDRQTLPESLCELYNKCAAPPDLDRLNPYRDEDKRALRYYTDPSYFFDLWKQEMLKECSSSRQGRAIRSPLNNDLQTGHKSPSRKKKPRYSEALPNVKPLYSQHQMNQIYQSNIMLQQNNSNQGRLHNKPLQNEFLNFPAEYQAPQHLMTGYIQAPPGMSLHGIAENNLSYNINDYNYNPQQFNFNVEQRQLNFEQNFNVIEESDGIQQKISSLKLEPNFGGFLEDDDDELPPPPPPVLSTLGNSSSASGNNFETGQQFGEQNTHVLDKVEQFQETIQYLPSGQPLPEEPNSDTSHTNIPPPPPPPAPGSFSNVNAMDNQLQFNDRDNGTGNQLLRQIKEGQVQREEEKKVLKNAENDVIAILQRRMEHVLGNDESSEESGNLDEDEWDD